MKAGYFEAMAHDLRAILRLATGGNVKVAFADQG
jgi:hypothetical protein